MIKYNKKMLLLLGLIPSIVFAKSDLGMDMFSIIIVEAFITIHMTIFFHLPFAKILTGNDQTKFKPLFKKFIIGRIIILLIGDFLLGEIMVGIDFFMVFIGAFVIVPISLIINRKKLGSNIGTNLLSSSSPVVVNTAPIIRDYNTSAILSKDYSARPISENNWYETTSILAKKSKVSIKLCNSCHSLNSADNEFCTNCGGSFKEQSVISSNGYCPKCRAKLNPGVKYCVNCGLELGSYVIVSSDQPVKEEGQIDTFFHQTEEKIMDSIITKELKENHYEKNMVIPGLRKRKMLLTALFAFVTFITICLIFFHLPIIFYGIYLIFLFIYIHNIKNYDIKKYILKQIKSRPDEKINNVVAGVVASASTKKASGLEYAAMFMVAILLPLVIFSKPRIFYEKVEDGYSMRFYAFGWSEMKKATIPDSYKGEPIVSLRGNAFSNMFLLEEVELPDTITEIRGKAFKNDFFLKKVNIPSKLEYLGGGSFYNCESIREIELPDTLTEMGGETFYNASNLREIKLSNKLTEIRGNTFENCASLEEITIPDSVVRIGGHAFHGASKLSKVNISANSQLVELGSSAFRDCYQLSEIYLPSGVTYNDKTFKGSGTIVRFYMVNDKGESVSFERNERREFKINQSESYYRQFFYYDRDYKRHSIYLNEINNDHGYYSYEFTYKIDDEMTNEFIIRSTEKSKTINNDMYVEVEYSSASQITLTIYYNK